MNKKGFTISQMLPLGLTIVVLGIGLSLGLTVLSDFSSDQCAGTWNATSGMCWTNSSQSTELRTDAFNGSYDGTSGVTKFTSYLPTIALVVVVAVIIGILVRYLFMKG